MCQQRPRGTGSTKFRTREIAPADLSDHWCSCKGAPPKKCVRTKFGRILYFMQEANLPAEEVCLEVISIAEHARTETGILYKFYKWLFVIKEDKNYQPTTGDATHMISTTTVLTCMYRRCQFGIEYAYVISREHEYKLCRIIVHAPSITLKFGQ